ncbi:hypothetical protein U3516DRAFT_732699 [Neocallimastix sp. 'constans']
MFYLPEKYLDENPISCIPESIGKLSKLEKGKIFTKDGCSEYSDDSYESSNTNINYLVVSFLAIISIVVLLLAYKRDSSIKETGHPILKKNLKKYTLFKLQFISHEENQTTVIFPSIRKP